MNDDMGRIMDAINCEAILPQGMAHPDNPIVLGVSGGADSVAMLHMHAKSNCKPVVAHLNHGTRGAHSDEDEAFVRRLAESIGVPCETAKRNIPAEAKVAGLSLEEHARNVRYEFFASVAEKYGASTIATAHHANDQAETVMMRLLRGTGPHGLAGIPPQRLWRGLCIVRPILAMSRADILEYLRANDLQWREDASNFDTSIRRNSIRHKLLPQLEQEYNPRLCEALARLAEAQHCDNLFWEAQLDALQLGSYEAFNRELLLALPNALLRRVVLHTAQVHGIELSHERMLAALHFVRNAKTGDYCDLGADCQFYCGVKEILLHKINAFSEPSACFELKIPGNSIAFGKEFVASFMDPLPMEKVQSISSPACQLFDADTLSYPLYVRNWKAGDRIAQLGMEGRKKLSDLMCGKGVPEPSRDKMPVLLSGDEIIWVVGLASSEFGKLMPATSRILKIEVCDAPE